MSRAPTKVRLQKTIKDGLRRCVYRRWEAEVKGNVLITKTTDLERLYRGNTPYPTTKPRRRILRYQTKAASVAALDSAIRRRRRQGYSAA
jgi:hypothetical protein